jgi:hypothetical protein
MASTRGSGEGAVGFAVALRTVRQTIAATRSVKVMSLT